MKKLSHGGDRERNAEVGDSSRLKDENQERKPYVSPEIKAYGSVTRLTANVAFPS